MIFTHRQGDIAQSLNRKMGASISKIHYKLHYDRGNLLPVVATLIASLIHITDFVLKVFFVFLSSRNLFSLMLNVFHRCQKTNESMKPCSKNLLQFVVKLPFASPWLV